MCVTHLHVCPQPVTTFTWLSEGRVCPVCSEPTVLSDLAVTCRFFGVFFFGVLYSERSGS